MFGNGSRGYDVFHNRAIKTFWLKALGTQILDDQVRLNLVVPAPRFAGTPPSTRYLNKVGKVNTIPIVPVASPNLAPRFGANHVASS